MGWSSGTDIFDATIGAAVEAGVNSTKLYTFATKLISLLEDRDWDCQCESEYWDTDGPVGKALKDAHPEWDDDV